MNIKTKPISVLCSLGLASIILAGCKPPAETPTTPAEPKSSFSSASPSAPSPTSAEAFNNVMGMLDENGSVLFYMGTERMFQAAEEKFEAFRGIIESIPKEEADGDEELKVIKRVADYAGKVFKRIGITEIAGMGVSGIAVDDELNRSRFVLHHKPENGKGHMWSLLGGEPHEFFGLDLMPANTKLASSQDLDFATLWRLVDSEIRGLGVDDVTKEWDARRKGIEEEMNLKIDDLMKSLGGKFSMAMTLDENDMIQVPGPDHKPMEIPRPDLLFVIAVNNAMIFERIKKEIPSQDSGITITKANGIERIQGPAFFPPIPSLKPLLAFDGKHLFVATSPEALDRALAVKAGDAPGLSSTEKFKRLSSLASTKGNGFSFADSKIGELVQEVHERTLADAAPEAKAISEMLMKIQKPSDMYTSFENTKYGWVWTAVGQQNAASAIMTSVAVGPVAVLAGIVVPNFVKARDKAQRTVCINNLKQTSLALKIYASDNDDRYPFQVPAAQGGTMDKASPDDLGDDRNAFQHMIRLRDELGSPKILTCPDHPGVKPATSWEEVTAEHLSYKLRTGKEVTEFNSEEVLMWCPFHHNVARTDGWVKKKTEADTEKRQAGSWKVR